MVSSLTLQKPQNSLCSLTHNYGRKTHNVNESIQILENMKIEPCFGTSRSTHFTRPGYSRVWRSFYFPAFFCLLLPFCVEFGFKYAFRRAITGSTFGSLTWYQTAYQNIYLLRPSSSCFTRRLIWFIEISSFPRIAPVLLLSDSSTRRTYPRIFALLNLRLIACFECRCHLPLALPFFTSLLWSIRCGSDFSSDPISRLPHTIPIIRCTLSSLSALCTNYSLFCFLFWVFAPVYWCLVVAFDTLLFFCFVLCPWKSTSICLWTSDMSEPTSAYCSCFYVPLVLTPALLWCLVFYELRVTYDCP